MRADRLVSILLLLQTRGRMKAQDLASRLEVSERTIYRDIDALSAAGVPIYAERGPGGGCALLEDYRTNLTGLTEAEVEALAMFRSPGPLADLGVSSALESALLKLSAALPARYYGGAEHARQRLHVDTARWFCPGDAAPHLKTLQEAVWQDRKVRFCYRKRAGEVSERQLDPYGLVAKTGSWYAVGMSGAGTNTAGMRVYRVSRMLSVEAGERFTRPATFDLPGFWQEWCKSFESSRPKVGVRVRVHPDYFSSLPVTLGEWVHEALASAERDGEGWAVLPLTFDTADAAASYVLGAAGMVAVVAPQALRERVLELASAMVASLARPT